MIERNGCTNKGVMITRKRRILVRYTLGHGIRGQNDSVCNSEKNVLSQQMSNISSRKKIFVDRREEANKQGRAQDKFGTIRRTIQVSISPSYCIPNDELHQGCANAIFPATCSR